MSARACVCSCVSACVPMCVREEGGGCNGQIAGCKQVKRKQNKQVCDLGRSFLRIIRLSCDF